VPLAAMGWRVLGLDLSLPMARAAAGRATTAPETAHLTVALAPMDRLPVSDAGVDLVVAHGIWNLARSGDEFRRGVREAARVLVPGGSVFVFTFSRHTLPERADPRPGEAFVFDQFSGEPQCFLTGAQLVQELGDAGLELDSAVPLVELNRPARVALAASRTPVIYQGVFRRR
jgi:SAM-dependent methyltransferase